MCLKPQWSEHKEMSQCQDSSSSQKKGEETEEKRTFAIFVSDHVPR